LFYRKLPDLKIECLVCPKRCQIADLERGYCGNKENRGGTYYSLVYGQPCAIHVDPIEKKPLFHYLPSTTAFSIATAGCNFECRFCQNWNIAQYRPEQIESVPLAPDEVVHQARKGQAATIAYTYSEPVVFYEYMYDCARAGRRSGIGSVMISNGYINEQPLRELCRYLTGVKIDLKSFSDRFYRDYCSGELEPVLQTLQTLQKAGMWFEIVVLIIPTLNDSPDEIRSMCSWISAHLGNDVPLHFSRFHPMYKITNLPPTPIKTLEMCYQTAVSAGLHYVYLGNVMGHQAESTCCPQCKKPVIKRMGYAILEINLKDGKCAACGRPIPGVWKPPAVLA
jgi:pyruvate formate lyase activating enzyme